MRPIDADYLKNLPFEKLIHTDFGDTAVPIEEIDNAPTVEPPEWQIEFLKKLYEKVRPHGEWVREDEVHSKCSLCGFKYADYRILFDYCPNCGARMEAENETN